MDELTTHLTGQATGEDTKEQAEAKTNFLHHLHAMKEARDTYEGLGGNPMTLVAHIMEAMQ